MSQNFRVVYCILKLGRKIKHQIRYTQRDSLPVIIQTAFIATPNHNISQ